MEFEIKIEDVFGNEVRIEIVKADSKNEAIKILEYDCSEQIGSIEKIEVFS